MGLETDITGTLVIPAKVETIGEFAFRLTKLTGLDLSRAVSLVTIGKRAFGEANLETIGEFAFYKTKLTGLDLSQAASLVTIGKRAFGEIYNLKGTLVIPAKVETIGEFAFYKTILTSLDLSQAALLVTIGKRAFGDTKLTGKIETPFKVPTYTKSGSTASFPSGVTIVKG